MGLQCARDWKFILFWMFFEFFKTTARPTLILAALLVLFTGCSDDDDAVESAASLAATTVNCSATTNTLSTQGPAGTTFVATISLADGAEKWCAFQSQTSVANGAVGEQVSFVIDENTSDAYRAADITVTYSNGYSILLRMWQMPASSHPEFQRAWAEQPAYRQGADYIYKTYYTTLRSTNKYLTGGYRRNFSICYDASQRVALWVAYPLHGCYTTPNSGRSDAWAYDPNDQLPLIERSEQANIVNTYGSGDARGHQCPSADRYNTDATNAMTFYATNIMPQNGSFNGGSWVSLESKIRTWAPTTVNKMRYDTLFVVTGAYLSGWTITDRNGNRVGKPSKCWKVLLKQKRDQNLNRPIWEFSADELQAIGFIFTNDAAGGGMKLRDAACTGEAVEQLTGFTFFGNPDPAVAAEVEKPDAPLSQWPRLPRR